MVFKKSKRGPRVAYTSNIRQTSDIDKEQICVSDIREALDIRHTSDIRHEYTMFQARYPYELPKL